MKKQTNERCWRKDGRVLNAEDARQVVEDYRAAYSPQRFAWLMRQAKRNATTVSIADVFEAAVPPLEAGN